MCPCDNIAVSVSLKLSSLFRFGRPSGELETNANDKTTRLIKSHG